MFSLHNRGLIWINALFTFTTVKNCLPRPYVPQCAAQWNHGNIEIIILTGTQPARRLQKRFSSPSLWEARPAALSSKFSSSIHLFICCIARSLNSRFCGPGRGERAAEAAQWRGGPASCPLLRSQRGEAAAAGAEPVPGEGGPWPHIWHHHGFLASHLIPVFTRNCMYFEGKRDGAGLALHRSAPAASCGTCRIWVECGLF